MTPLGTRTWNCDLDRMDHNHQITFFALLTSSSTTRGCGTRRFRPGLVFLSEAPSDFGDQQCCLHNCKGRCCKSTHSWVRANFYGVASNLRRCLRSSPALSCCHIEANEEKLPERKTLSDDVAGGAASGAADGMLIGPRATFVNLERNQQFSIIN